jgi:septum site-determining protein MinD
MTTQRAKTVAVYSGSGGVGKTLVAANLAVSLHLQDSGRVLFIDGGHPMPGEAISLLGLDRAKTLGEMAPILGRLTPEAFSTYLITTAAGLAVLPLVGDVLQSRLVTPDLYRRMIDLASAAFDLVVVDMPSGVGTLTQAQLDGSDYVCVVGEPTPSGVNRTRACLDYLRSVQFPIGGILVAMNRVPERGGVAPEQIEKYLGLAPFITLPYDVEPIAAAAVKRMSVIQFAPRHAIARGIDRLGREITTLGLRKISHTPLAVESEESPEETLRRLKLRVHRRLVDEIDLKKADLAYLGDPIKLQEVRTRAESKVLSLLEEEKDAKNLSREVRRRLLKEVLDEALGLGPLEDLLADPAVTEIMVNRFDQIYVERAGKLQPTAVKFLANEQLRGVIERIVAPLGRRIDEKVPMVDARLKDGSRVNAIIPPLALKGPALTIRKFAKRVLKVPDLIGYGSLTEQMATFLGAAVEARMNIIISGGTGSGKTTLLNVLSSFIPDDERIITIEDAAELQLPQDHVISLESRPANIEGEGAITIRELVKNALRMRPDRIVVGECRSGEALDMLQAMNTGHDGSLTTLHANTPRDALSRLETMALMSGLELPSRAIRDQIASAINLIVQQSRLQDGSRRITHITEVTGQEGEVFTTADVFVFRQTGLAPDGTVYGQFVPTGYVPGFIETLSRRGIKVPREIFLHQTA